MTQEKQDYLFRKYTSLFPSKEDRGDPMKTCLAFGIECGDGWFNILDKMMGKIASLNPKYFQFAQIKEKFGALRVYFGASGEEDDGFWDKVDAIIDEAELASALTCEVCGEEGSIVSIYGWLSALCTKCKEKAIEERK